MLESDPCGTGAKENEPLRFRPVYLAAVCARVFLVLLLHGTARHISDP